MFRKISALIWLRSQVLLSNKNIIIQILFPFILALVFNNIMKSDTTTGESIIYMCLNLTFTLSSGNMISSSISEDKEKNNYKSLKLSGVRDFEYLLSLLFYPIAIVLISIIIFPIMLDVSFGERYLAYFIISLLVALCILLVNLFVGAISDTQTKAQINGLVPTMAFTFLPLLSQFNTQIKEFVDYTFLGAYVNFFNKKNFEFDFNSIKVSLLWVLVLFVLTVLSLKKKSDINRLNLLKVKQVRKLILKKG